MRRKLVPLLSVFALLLVAAGGAAAAGDASTTITPDDAPDDGGDVGICLVGADSPCNDTPAADASTANASANSTSTDEQVGDSDSDEGGQVWIPEDRNHDGEIDERFRGDSDDTDAGICQVGADSPCNAAPPTHPTPGGDVPAEDNATHPIPINGTTEIGAGGGNSDGGQQVWIPEDQNHDGRIDARFFGGLGPFADITLPFVGGF